MRSLVLLLLLLLVAPAGAAPALFPTEKIAFERVATGYRFTEGPAADARGDVYFTDIPNERILKLNAATNKVSVYREKSGRANGLLLDRRGRLLVCEGGRRRVVRIDGKQTEVLAARYGGKRLNSPNDLTLDAKGGIWFTDPRYGKQTDREIDIMGVYYRAADGTLTRVIDDLPRPNGILLSAAGTTLYVAANKRKLIMAYDVKQPGRATRGRVFARLDPKGRGGPDGLTLDNRGNLYAAGQGHIWIWNAKGALLHKLNVPEGPSNCAFGSPEHDTLYVTARTSLYRVKTNVKGASAISGVPRKAPSPPSVPPR